MKQPRSLQGHQDLNTSRCADVWRDSGHILDTPTHCPGRQGPCMRVRADGGVIGALRVHQCSAASSGGIYAPAEQIGAGQAAVLGVIPKKKKKKNQNAPLGAYETNLSRDLQPRCNQSVSV